MAKIFDVGIIGAGIAGVFASLRIADKYSDNRVLLIDLGKGVAKRRRQLEAWFGCFPTGDGKIYQNDYKKVSEIVDGRTVKGAKNYFNSWLYQINDNKIIKDLGPSSATLKTLEENEWDVQLNDYVQWKPEDIHGLSKIIVNKIESVGNITFSFDNEVFSFIKEKRHFAITTEEGEFLCKKIIMCVGRSGWRWATKVYKDFGITLNDDLANFGVRVELPCQYMKEFNKSHCTLTKGDITVGPLSWNGTVIPEDHADLAISAFRSNEERWKSDKVSFNLIGSKYFKDDGCNQTDRLAKLAFLLSNDRIGKERVKSFLRGNSQLSLLPEYSWLNEAIEDLTNIMPNILTKGYFHMPAIIPMASTINLTPKLESDVDGLFIAGESANIRGIGASAMSGIIAADGIFKGK
jgi:uncharacterized FAD-dependent dehydrogenase